MPQFLERKAAGRGSGALYVVGADGTVIVNSDSETVPATFNSAVAAAHAVAQPGLAVVALTKRRRRVIDDDDDDDFAVGTSPNLPAQAQATTAAPEQATFRPRSSSPPRRRASRTQRLRAPVLSSGSEEPEKHEYEDEAVESNDSFINDEEHSTASGSNCSCTRCKSS